MKHLLLSVINQDSKGKVNTFHVELDRVAIKSILDTAEYVANCKALEVVETFDSGTWSKCEFPGSENILKSIINGFERTPEKILKNMHNIVTALETGVVECIGVMLVVEKNNFSFSCMCADVLVSTVPVSIEELKSDSPYLGLVNK